MEKDEILLLRKLLERELVDMIDGGVDFVVDLDDVMDFAVGFVMVDVFVVV